MAGFVQAVSWPNSYPQPHQAEKIPGPRFGQAMGSESYR